jgi:hypothetical protein
VQPVDVLYKLSAADLDSYKYATLQCQGNNHYFWNWGGSAGSLQAVQPDPLQGVSATGAAFTAFATVPSPGEPGKAAFLWELHATDPDTAGANAKRCEFSLGWREYAYPGKVLSRQIRLPANEDFWWAVAVRPEDWRGTSSRDSQILWQWHDGYGGGLPPFLSLITYGNRMVIQVTHDMSTTPRNSTLTRVVPWVQDNWTPNSWLRFVVQARKDLVNPANGYVRVWMDGRQIVDYSGPFGYNVTQPDYAKVGIYHWISAANLWDPAMPMRRMHSKGPVQVSHRDGYTWQSIDRLMD